MFGLRSDAKAVKMSPEAIKTIKMITPELSQNCAMEQ
jgi:hypothetical protein